MNDATNPADISAPPGAVRAGGWRSALIARRRWVLAAIFVAAVIVRLAVLYAAAGPGTELTGDSVSYDEFARAIAAGDWWGHHVSYREPGYPLLVAATYRLGGYSQRPAGWVNAFLCALTCLALYALGKRVFGVGVGLMAAAWFVPYYHSVFYSYQLLRESLVTLLFVAFLVTLFDAARGSRRSAVLSALVYAALAHTDARFVFHAPFVLAFLLIAGGGLRRGLVTAAVLFAVWTAAMLPWQVRNYRVYDHIVLVNTRTLVLPVPWKNYDEIGPVAGLEEKEPDTRVGVRRLTGLRKAIYDVTEFYRIFRFRGEGKNLTDIWAKPWSAFHNAASIAMYGTLVPFFIYGFWTILRRRMTHAYILVFPVLAHTLLHMIKWALPRYRIPIEPVLILVAFFAVATLWERAAAKRG